jgi:hypothetical protein
MANKDATIRGLQCLGRTFAGFGSREAWLLTCDFPAYTAAADTARILLCGASIDATARDGKTSTLRAGTCVQAGYDGTLAVYPTGASVQALTVSSDTLSGQLSTAAGVDETKAATTVPAAILVVVDRS